MVVFNVTQDINRVTTNSNMPDITGVSDVKSLLDHNLYDGTRKYLRQIAVDGYIEDNGVLKGKVSSTELYIFKEHVLTDEAVHDFIDGIDLRSKVMADALMRSAMYKRDLKGSYKLPEPKKAESRSWSGILYDNEIYPSFRGSGIENYILQNLSEIVYAGTGDIMIRCIATIPDITYSKDESREHPDLASVKDMLKVLEMNGYETAWDEDCVKNFGVDVYIKDYLEDYLAEK